MQQVEKEGFRSKVKNFVESTRIPSLLRGYVFGPDPRSFDFAPQTTNVDLKPDRLGQLQVKGTELANRIFIPESFINKGWAVEAVLKDEDTYHVVWTYKGEGKVGSKRNNKPQIIWYKGEKIPSEPVSFIRTSSDERRLSIIERSAPNAAIISNNYFDSTFLYGTNLHSTGNVKAAPVDKTSGIVLDLGRQRPGRWQQIGVWSISFSVESISRGIRRLQRELDGYTKQNGERVKGFYEELADAKSFWPDRSPTYLKEVQDVLGRGIKEREERIKYLKSLRVENPIDLFAEKKLPEPQKEENALQTAAAS